MQEKLLRPILTALLKTLFRVEVRGLEHFAATRGQPTMIVSNHQSFLDPMLLAVFMPEKPAFAMNTFQARKWYFKPMMTLVDVFVVDPLQPMSTKTIIQRLKLGKKVVVFPEGRITTSGGIMKVYEGTGMIIDRTRATVLPVRVEGAQYSKLSRLQGKVKTRWFPKITITLLPPQRMDLPEKALGRKRRRLASRRVYDILTQAAFDASSARRTLPAALVDATRRHGRRHVIATDPTRMKLSYGALWTRTFVLAEALKKALPSERRDEGIHAVGVLLPTSFAGMIAFLALHAIGRLPAMLNFSAGPRNLLSACDAAQISTIITSRAFVEKGKLEPVIDALTERCSFIWLEDVREGLGPLSKLRGALRALAPERALRHVMAAPPDDPAVVLFTSGSEGTPKGVVLSHANLLSNIHQSASRLAFTESDILFNALPIFHSFGLTGGMLLPLMLGIRVFLYPSPLHYRIVPELCYDSGATVLLGTDTFFSGYARYAHSFDFHAVRLAVAGAEKLKAATRQLYADRFGLRILEGYGVTETSPVISANTPVENKPGSVGRLFPGMHTQLEPVEGISQGGRLLIQGPNVMLGYVRPERPGVLEPQGPWYDTGDIVDIDEEGFITILGRAKRFAKIGGEMVSLAVVEECAAALWPGHMHAAIAVQDARKGEQILLVSECADATREPLLRHIQEAGLPELAVPRRVMFMAELPKLGSGKADYPRLKELLTVSA